MTFKFINNVCPYSLIEIYEYSPQCRIESRSNFAKLKVPFRKTNMGETFLALVPLYGTIYPIYETTVFFLNMTWKKQYFENLAGSLDR